MKGKYIGLDKNRRKRNVVIGCLVSVVLLFAVIVGSEIVTGISGKKTDTSEGLEIIHKAEGSNVTEIETKIQKLEEKESSGEETRSLKERFASTVVFGDVVTEGFTEYDVLNVSSVISGTGMEWKEQIAKLKEVNPKIVFVAYCASDILDSEGDTEVYIKKYQKRVEEIRKTLPTASIFVNSLLDVNSAAASAENQYKKLEEYNQDLREMCDKMQIGFTDNSALALTQYYEEDGILFKSGFYPIWAERMAEVASL